MAAIVGKLIEVYYYVNNDISDPRTVNYPMISNPFIIIGIVVVYNVFVQCIGQRWMSNKKPYDLKNVIIAYDLVQIILNSYLAVKIVILTYGSGNYNIFCQPVDTGTSPKEVEIMNTVYCYFLLKIIDLVDTVFFVLSKKSNHISFLHLYHHSGMVICGWIGVKYVPGGQAIFFGAVNGIVHALMYTYYLLAALKYFDSRHIFWKRSLTELQMIQFCLLALHQVFALYCDCGFPRFISYMVIPQQVFVFAMFADFYRKTYIVKKKLS